MVCLVGGWSKEESLIAMLSPVDTISVGLDLDRENVGEYIEEISHSLFYTTDTTHCP